MKKGNWEIGKWKFNKIKKYIPRQLNCAEQQIKDARGIYDYNFIGGESIRLQGVTRILMSQRPTGPSEGTP